MVSTFGVLDKRTSTNGVFPSSTNSLVSSTYSLTETVAPSGILLMLYDIVTCSQARWKLLLSSRNGLIASAILYPSSNRPCSDKRINLGNSSLIASAAVILLSVVSSAPGFLSSFKSPRLWSLLPKSFESPVNRNNPSAAITTAAAIPTRSFGDVLLGDDDDVAPMNPARSSATSDML